MLVAAAYLITALLSLHNARKCRTLAGAGGFTYLRARSRRRVWLGLAIVLLAIAIDRLLDLHSLLVAVGRHMATNGGWYSERRGLQRAFIAAAIAVGLMAIGATLSAARGAGGWSWLAATGTSFLAIFVVIRTASLHDVDLLIRSEIVSIRWGSVRIEHLSELGGIAIVILAAIACGVGARRPAPLRSRTRRRYR